MTPDTYAVRDSTGRPVAFYDSRELAQYDTERYPGGTVVGLVGVDRLGGEWLVFDLAERIYAETGREVDPRLVLAALRAELEES